MKSLALTLMTLVLAAGAGFAAPVAAPAGNGLPGAVRAGDGLPHPERTEDGSGELDNIDVTYHGGRLMQHVQVSTLFMGQAWQGNPFPAYLNNFYNALFDDGRYMATLSQYSASGYRIGNGRLAGTAWDHRPLAARVTDAEIQDEIVLAIQYHAVPAPQADSLYVVYTAPGTVVDDGEGGTSGVDFYGYHSFVETSAAGRFAYAVVAYPQQTWRLTKTSSHELAEAVTDPEPADGTLGWYDDNNGEIGDIPVAQYAAGRIAETDYLDILVGADGTKYIVQKEWSNQDGAPVSFTE